MRIGAIRMLAAVTSGMTTILATAGDLNPPVGPVGPTMKTLAQVEPRTAVSAATTPGDGTFPASVFTISQPGSYYLAGSFQVPADKVGIKITCNDVSLDLNGFTISSGLAGVYAMSSGGPGVPLTGLSVSNGKVRSATNYGIGLDVAHMSRVESVIAIDCDWGIDVGDGSLVQNCVVSGGEQGIEAGDHSVVRNCTSNGNDNLGFYLGDGSSATGCLASGNGGYGYIAGNGSSVTNCVARNNGTVGIGALQECVIADCSVQGNGTDGITTGQGCVVRHCTAGNSGRHGIAVIAGTTVEGCTARGNGEDGINATWQTRLIGNICISNGAASASGAGIRITSWGSRVEDNMCCGNDKGIVVSGTDNVVVKNTAKQSSNVNFEVVAGNELAPVVTNPGSNNYSTATPWSNFGY